MPHVQTQVVQAHGVGMETDGVYPAHRGRGGWPLDHVPRGRLALHDESVRAGTV